MELNVGDRVEKECIACREKEVWRVERISKESYSDGRFKTFHLISEKNCLMPGIRTSRKDVHEVMQEFTKL